MTLEPFQKKILASIRRWPKRPLSPGEFETLAILTYRRQRKLNPVYRRFCEAVAAPSEVKRWQDIPALPVSAFKAGVVACFPKAAAERVFRTSGTTLGRKRGEHYFRDLSFYDAAVEAQFAGGVMGWFTRSAHFASLVSPAREKKDSSLSYMAARAMRVFADSKFEAVRGGEIRFAELARRLEAWSRGKKPVVIFATTLALGSFLKFMEDNDRILSLPEGSRIMETGGSKGKASFVSSAECARLAAKRLGVPKASVVNEYGMTELSSQFYDKGLHGRHAGAPWVRVLLIDPVTGRPAKRGLVRIYDLANQDSCFAVQTEDEAVSFDDGFSGFKLIGRKPGADLRGCSLAFEELEALAR